MRPVGDPSCHGTELLSNILVSDSVAVNMRHKYIPLSSVEDLIALDLVFPFRNYFPTIPLIAQYVQYMYLVTSSGSFSFSPLKQLISYSDLSEIVNGFDFTLTHLNTTNYDCYTVTHFDALVDPPYYPNRTWTAEICGRGMQVDFTFNHSETIQLHDSSLNNGSMYFFQYYSDYFNEYVYHCDYGVANRSVIIQQALERNDEYVINTAKILLIDNFMNQVSGDFGTGTCLGNICNSLSFVVITSLLNAGSSVPLFSCIFTYIVFKHHKNKYGIDIEMAIKQKDQIVLNS